ncbi:AMP-binding protein [Alsobacter sp. SYSU M60028]|uniref:AMP-binding protein n=1 Tax=Alsobacter ponti TaxID=2962936 RepID=A0ABT1LGV3_9HYPH|nr:AMP-binding protein [Alsobacter ponti]
MSDAQFFEPEAEPAPPWAGVSLLDLFQASAGTQGDAAFLVEHGDTDEKRLGRADAVTAVRGMAREIRDLGLAPGRCIAISLPGGKDAVIALMAALACGLRPCLLPPVAREEQIAAVLEAARPEAIVTIGRLASLRPAETLRRAAAAHGGPGLILAVGDGLPAGVIPLGRPQGLADAGERSLDPDPASRPPPILTCELTPGGAHVFRHQHEGLVAAALLLVLRAGIVSRQPILSTLSPMSHAGLVSGLVPALLVGGTLRMTPLFSGAALLRALTEGDRPHLVAPGPLETALAESGVLGDACMSSTILAHRAPARFDRLPAARRSGSPVVDLLSLGECASLAARRGPGGRAGFALGETRIPEDDGALVLSLRERVDGLLEAGGAAAGARGAAPTDPVDPWTRLDIVARADAEGAILAIGRPRG